MSETWWINGQPQTLLPLGGRGLAYGDGLFETMRLIDGRIPLLDYHLSRLERGAQSLQLSIDRHKLDDSIGQAIAASPDEHVLKIICMRSGPARGYAPSDNRVDILLRSSVLKKDVSDKAGIVANLCKIRLASQPALAGIKHLNRLEQVLAALESGSDEGILLDNRDKLIEAISSNLIFVSGNRWIYPDLSESGVEGVMQSFLKDQAHDLGVNVSVDQVSRSQLGDFEEILLVNAVRGVRNLGKIGGEWVASSQTCGDRVRAYLTRDLHPGFGSF